MNSLMRTTLAVSAVVLAALATAADSAPGRWPAERAWQWYEAQPWLIGFNYIPATAINTTEMWQADTFDPKTIDAELALAKQNGFNCARVFLQYLVWEGDPAGLKDRMAQFLAIADRHGMRTLFILFDICNFSPYPDPFLGKQPEPIPGKYAHAWTPSPGPKRAHDRAAWPKLEQYVKDVVGAFARDKRVLAWETWNEPLEDRGPTRTGGGFVPLGSAGETDSAGGRDGLWQQQDAGVGGQPFRFRFFSQLRPGPKS